MKRFIHELQTHQLPIDKQHPLVALDEAFSKGRMVVLGGQPGQPGSGRTAYEQNLGYQYDAAHYILVMGKSPEGRYLVADPLSRKGVVELTAAELASFEPHFGTEVWR